MEKKIKVMGKIGNTEYQNKVINPFKGISPWGWHWEQQVYDRKGIARTIKSGEGSGNAPKVIKRWKGK